MSSSSSCNSFDSCTTPALTSQARLRHLGRRIDFGSFSANEQYYPAGAVLPLHIHECHSMCLTLAGNGFETLERSKEEVRPGTLIIRPGGLRHSDQYGQDGLRAFLIEIGPQFNDNSIARVFSQPTVLYGGLLPSLAMRLYRESKIEDSATPIVIEGLLLELLGHASRWLSTPKLRLPPWLNTARDICHEHFNDPLNLFQIATLVGVHPTHLARSFRKYFRMTVGDYIRQLRLDWAISRLAETKDSIAEIAIAAGFYDQSHFTNSFKQRIGLSPAEFRASVTNRMR